MFWKNKKTPNTSFYNDNNDEDKRLCFRVKPDPAKPVVITIKDETFNAVNISASGICMRTQTLAEGASIPATINLPDDSPAFSVILKVVMKHKGFCRCRFSHIDSDAEDQIYAYTLEIQKVKIRQKQHY